MEKMNSLTTVYALFLQQIAAAGLAHNEQRKHVQNEMTIDDLFQIKITSDHAAGHTIHKKKEAVTQSDDRFPAKYLYN